MRDINFGSSENINYFAHFQATDIAKHARGDADRFGDYNVWLVPTNSMVKFHWERWYKVIANANTIISRIENTDLSEAQKSSIRAEAKFFRGLSYRYLVYIYGAVPLILEEVTSPRTDLVRASKQEVLAQIIADMEEAAANLPAINQVVDGKVSNLVASHLLAETLIAAGRLDDAITASSKVINDPNVGLMTTRFGNKANEQDKDVYWDLFQRGNQKRSGGNRESLWIARMEPDVPGGSILSAGGTQNCLERFAVPAGWTLTDPEGKTGMHGQGMSDYNMGGRGVSYMMNTDYFLYDIWQGDWDNDVRNSPYNIVRDVKYTNTASVWYDSSAIKYTSQNWKQQAWRWYPWPSKVTTPGDHPDELFADKANNILKATAGSTYSDMYILRLAETYLLRAEAYHLKGDNVQAANDINQVRLRSIAKAITPDQVSLEYILDERARELTYEEPRRITLQRMGLLVERVRKYNDLNRDDIRDFHNLWPIPSSDIEANKDVKMEQNPGYF